MLLPVMVAAGKLVWIQAKDPKGLMWPFCSPAKSGFQKLRSGTVADHYGVTARVYEVSFSCCHAKSYDDASKLFPEVRKVICR